MDWIVTAMAEPDKDTGPRRSDEFRRSKRGRNLAILGAIFAFFALFYLITIVRML